MVKKKNTCNKIKLGEIYKAHWNDFLIRVIGLDDFEVFYDRYWEHDNSWAFASNLEKKCSFYRTSKNVLIEKAELIDIEELTKEEFNIFRPDLTIRTCRIDNVSWTNNHEDLNKHLSNIATINTNKIWLYPFGPKGGLKKGELITAENNSRFTQHELIKMSQEIQKTVNTNETKGVGIYRIGIQKQIPSYYIGEYIDLAGIMRVKK